MLWVGAQGLLTDRKTTEQSYGAKGGWLDNHSWQMSHLTVLRGCVPSSSCVSSLSKLLVKLFPFSAGFLLAASDCSPDVSLKVCLVVCCKHVTNQTGVHSSEPFIVCFNQHLSQGFRASSSEPDVFTCLHYLFLTQKRKKGPANNVCHDKSVSHSLPV